MICYKNLYKEENDKCIYNILSNLSNTIIHNNKKMNNLKQYLKMNKYHKIYVIYQNNDIVGLISFIIEKKIIHNFQSVMHIEDFIIDKSYRKNGLGSIVIQDMIKLGKKFNCYKIILNCNNETKHFYEKNNFICKNNEMSYYY